MGSANPAVTADAYARSDKTSTVYNASTLRTGSGYEAFLYFPRPFPMQANLRSAKLQLWLAAAVSAGTRTINVQLVQKTWSESKLTWKNRPGVTGTAVARTTTVVAKNGLVELDIVTLMQAVSNGSASAWFGLRITSTSALSIWSSEASVAAMRPRLAVTWDDQPKAPEKLYPAGGRAVSAPAPVVRCDFTDVSGDVRCAGIQVRLFTTEAGAIANTAPSWDSGQVSTSNPELNLSTAGWRGASAGAEWWWTARVQDGAGLWSDWAVPASFTYRPLPVVTLTQPSGTTVSDTSPAIWWTATGQVAYQALVRDSVTGGILWDSGRVTETDNQIEAPSATVNKLGHSYLLEVYVWDSYQREAVPGAPSAAVASKMVTYSPDGTVTAPSGLEAIRLGNLPSVQLTWSRTSVPDSYIVLRDGFAIASLDPADVSAGGSNYLWVDTAANGWEPHTYQVSAVADKKGSDSATVTIQFQLGDFWITDPTGEVGPVVLLGTNVQWSMGEESEWHSPLGSAGSVLITQALRGMEGSASDERPDGAFIGVSNDVIADRLRAHRRTPGKLVNIVAHKYSFPAVLSNIQVLPIDSPEGSTYSVGFQFREDVSGPNGIPL